ncbi:flagellar hook-basal body complex protein [Clostridium sediminicola]|uniref:flagellar hook-basal body complex protein n=1 Tax=Clostridium sediminicola TaxID=3114879 RepID=UPI0031F23805
MLKSLYSGVSGMRSNQIKMDVIGNNIANVNTTAFKASRVKFQDMLNDTLSTAQSPDYSGRGGKNPKQVGLGTTVSSVDTIMTDGALQPTGRELDFAIENNGFFVVAESAKRGTTEEDINGIKFTRDGAFYRDNEGNLVNASGFKVLGYMPADKDGDSIIDYTKEPPEYNTGFDEVKAADKDNLNSLKIPVKIENSAGEIVSLETFNVDASGQITAIYSDQESYVLGRVAIAKFKNPEGLDKLGSNTYGATSNSGEIEYGVAGSDAFGSIKQGVLEMGNVDLANEFTEMIITSRAYQANSRSITTSDEMLQELLNLKR